MKRIIATALVVVLMLSVSSVAFATYANYSGGASKSFDTYQSLSRIGTSWSYARDECEYSATAEDSPYASPHKSQMVSTGGVALSNQVEVWGGDICAMTWKSGAQNYTSAKMRLSAISSYFYAVGKFHAA